MKGRIFLFVLTVSFSFPVFAGGGCTIPTESDLKRFFQNHATWMEVKPNDHSVKEDYKPIRIVIDFDDARDSRITMSGKSMGKVAQVCNIPTDGSMNISASGQNIKVENTSDGIRTFVPAFGKYYYFVKEPPGTAALNTDKKVFL